MLSFAVLLGKDKPLGEKKSLCALSSPAFVGLLPSSLWDFADLSVFPTI